MKDFTKSMKFIVSFLVLVMLLSMFTNKKLTYSFLLLVFLSMLAVNYEKIGKVMEGLQYGK